MHVSVETLPITVQQHLRFIKSKITLSFEELRQSYRKSSNDLIKHTIN